MISLPQAFDIKTQIDEWVEAYFKDHIANAKAAIEAGQADYNDAIDYITKEANAEAVRKLTSTSTCPISNAIDKVSGTALINAIGRVTFRTSLLEDLKSSF